MTRTSRVRDMTVYELELEFSRARDDVLVELLLGAEPDSKQERRLRRVMRELARRDYINRDHGRRCTCSDCMYLLDVWRTLQRRTPIVIRTDENG